MTLPSDAHPADEDKTPGHALSPAGGDSHGIDPFLAAATTKTEAAAATRSLGARLLDYSAHAAIVVGLIGFAWTVGDRVVNRPTAAQIETSSSGAAKTDLPKAEARTDARANELADLRRSNAQMAADIQSLHRTLDKLSHEASEDRTPAQLRILQAGLETVKGGLSATKAETNTALAQLSGRIDKLGHEPSSKMQQLVDRLGKLEHGTVDTTATGSLPPAAPAAKPMAVAKADPKAVPTPPAKPAEFAEAEPAHAAEDPAKPQVLAGWIVRDVYDGVALIEGRRGTLEVVPGVSIPGAGVVKSIDRQGHGWTVTTTKGLVAYAAPPRDRRPTGRDVYRGYRYDF